MLDINDLADDPRFRTNKDRVSSREQLRPLLVNRLQSRSAGEWLKQLKAAGIPCGAVRDLGQLFSDPQIIERAMVIALEHPIAGTIRQLGIPVKLSDTPGALHSPPPTLGQHTDAVLRKIGFSADEIFRFKENGAI